MHFSTHARNFAELMGCIVLRICRHRGLEGSATYQKVALFQNCAYSFRMSREIHIPVSALPGSLLPGLLLSFFLLR